MTDDPTWSDYYDEHEGREPRELLVDVLGTFAQPGDAVDLGCGSGIDTAALLAGGWTVFAADAEDEAIRRLLARVPVGATDRLRTQVARMEDVELPPADLVWASFSLFFCDPPRFPAVWGRIMGAVRPGGRFAGQLLGDRDSWAPQTDISAFTRDEALALFDGWALERFEEEDKDEEDDPCAGTKHWHVFHVVAQAPPTRP